MVGGLIADDALVSDLCCSKIEVLDEWCGAEVYVGALQPIGGDR